jgi:hypothetical protein
MSSPSVHPGILSAAVGAAACASVATGSGGPSKPSSEDCYRFYQCVFDTLYPQHVKCKAIDKSKINTIAPGITQIIPIEKWIPTAADRAIIRWKLFEKGKLDFE